MSAADLDDPYQRESRAGRIALLAARTWADIGVEPETPEQIIAPCAINDASVRMQRAARCWGSLNHALEMHAFFRFRGARNFTTDRHYSAPRRIVVADWKSQDLIAVFPTEWEGVYFSDSRFYLPVAVVGAAAQLAVEILPHHKTKSIEIIAYI